MRAFLKRVVETIRQIPFNPMATLWDSDRKHRRDRDKRDY